MNKLVSALSAIMIVGMTTIVSAGLLTTEQLNALNAKYDDSQYGLCLGAYAGNDNIGLQDLATYIKSSVVYIQNNGSISLDLTKIGKDDNPFQVNANIDFDAITGEYKFTGTWATNNGESVDFYTVKAGKKFSIWWMNEGGATNGLWTTDGLGNKGTSTPDVSHLTAFNDKNTTDVPEPSVLSLFGLSLLGLGFIRRKKN